MIRFNVAIKCTRSSLLYNPLRLAIESIPSITRPQTPPYSPSERLQDTIRQISLKNGLQFTPSSPIITTPTSTTKDLPSRSKNLASLPVNPDKIQKLCVYLREIQDQADVERCIGYLEPTDSFKHYIYQIPTSKQLVNDSKSISLEQILQLARENDWIEKLKLARLLALAVLRFYHTPWLTESWSSKDVHFLGKDIFSGQNELLEYPYLNAKLTITTSNNRQIEPLNYDTSSLAINKTLFNLGVVLIELGYDSPFETLRGKEACWVGMQSQVTDILIARNLGKQVHRKLNMTYSRLVQKCLDCNFGVATELEDIELQNAIMEDVVKQLESCMDQYKTFNLLAPLYS
ncbi:hypothetical protein B7463_g4073, partial [Scytalidium lignicola]